MKTDRKSIWRLAGRLLRLMYQTNHALLPLLFASALAKAALPFVPILLSARLLDQMTASAPAAMLVQTAAQLVVLTAACTLLMNLLEEAYGMAREHFERHYDFALRDKMMRMDYALLQSARLRQQAESIKADNAVGQGVYSQIWNIKSAAQGLFSTMIAAGAFSSLFTVLSRSPHPWASGLGLAALALLVALTVTLTLLLGWRAARQLESTYAEVSRNNLGFLHLTTAIVGTATNGKDIRLYRAQSQIDAQIKELYVNFGIRFIRAVTKNSILRDGSSAALNTVTGGAVYLFVLLQALQGVIQVGGVTQYAGSVFQFISGVTALATSLAAFTSQSTALGRYLNVLDLQNRQYKGTLPVEKRNDHLQEIEFQNVSFRYPGSDAYALKDFSLKLRIGEKLAVVGRNGSGKTTLVKLLTRLYDPTEGVILLNGIDIRKYDLAQYRSLFSVVFQDFSLLSFPLGECVAASLEVDAPRAEQCLKEAGLEKRLASLPLGLNTPLYKDYDAQGVLLSGGEAQKVALARALYRDAPFLALDEPTAALDPVSEYEIYTRFDQLAGDHTALYISHRLASCRFCDDIAVLDGGKVVQRGKHETLLAQSSGLYADLWNAQAQYYQTCQAQADA